MQCLRGVYIAIVCATLRLSSAELHTAPAAMELIVHTDDQIRMTKYIRGVYTPAGQIVSVEGNIDQIHPNTLCHDRPALQFGNIYILKLEPQLLYNGQERFCKSAADKASIAIRYGATAVILITTDQKEAALELEQLTEPLERPVIVVEEPTEEDKLFTILNYRESAYMRISPIKNSQISNVGAVGSDLGIHDKESITYIGIAVIFGLIVVLSLIAIGVVVKLKRMRRQIQYHSRGQLLAAIGSHKYAGRYRGSASINSSMESSSENCPICLDHYRPGEEIRVLPCSHKYHKKCVDKWLLDHSTCPCCCGDVAELLEEGYKQLSKARKTLRGKKTTVRLQSEGLQLSETIDESCRYLPRRRYDLLHQHMCGKHWSGRHQVRCNREAVAVHSHDLIHEQYSYLLRRLNEIKRQRPASLSASDDAANRMSIISSCYSSIPNIDENLPPENVFIGDSCQGGIPQQCNELCFSDADLDSAALKHYTSSKSTLPSLESENISPGVSEWEINLTRSHSERCMSHLNCAYHDPLQRSRSRVVRFREPESEVMSSTEEACDQDSDITDSDEVSKLLDACDDDKCCGRASDFGDGDDDT